VEVRTEQAAEPQLRVGRVVGIAGEHPDADGIEVPPVLEVLTLEPDVDREPEELSLLQRAARASPGIVLVRVEDVRLLAQGVRVRGPQLPVPGREVEVELPATRPR
jgi:hypothetical protein